jgi:hypothetical protein
LSFRIDFIYAASDTVTIRSSGFVPPGIFVVDKTVFADSWLIDFVFDAAVAAFVVVVMIRSSLFNCCCISFAVVPFVPFFS